MGSSGKETRKLLSLDGGGIRGLSTIAILRELMDRLAMKRNVPVVHPWQEFDMIGGTSTGGLLAIMLGRLRMSIDECEEAYIDLSERIFTANRSKGNIVGRGLDFINIRGKFPTESLEACVKDVVKSKGLPEDELLYNISDDGCKVFVSAIRAEDGGNTVIRSYINPEMPNPMRRYCRIWEAGRATSAASTFFDPIAIGPHQVMYVDGALGLNNPIRLVDRESRDIWPDSDRIFISIGTGTDPGTSLDGNILQLAQRIKEIATETERTHEGFYRDNERTLVLNKRYFRFNVEGLERIGLEEYKARSAIYAATATYLETGIAGTMIKELTATLTSLAPTSSIQGEDDHFRAMPGSLPVPPQTIRSSRSPSPGITLAEKFQARREREEIAQKLFRAVSLNKVAEVKELLGKGADPNVFGKSLGSNVLPIYVAAKGKFDKVLQLLIQHNAKVDGFSPGFGTALHGAIDVLNQDGVEALLKAGADPNGIGSSGYTPLQNAAQYGDTNMGLVEVLLIAGADVNATTPIGTALDRALDMSQIRTARILLDAGADIDLIKDNNQYKVQGLLPSEH